MERRGMHAADLVERNVNPAEIAHAQRGWHAEKCAMAQRGGRLQASDRRRWEWQLRLEGRLERPVVAFW